MDEYGRPLGKEDVNAGNSKNLTLEPKNLDEAMFKMGDSSSSSTSAAQKKKYTPINSYKPQGNLVYGDDLLNSLEDVFDSV